MGFPDCLKDFDSTARKCYIFYQESRGVPRNKEISFVTLVTSFSTQAYRAISTILVMLPNLIPLVDGIVYFIRFVLDKMIDIMQTEDHKESVIKIAILLGELIIINFIIFIILNFFFVPVSVLTAKLISKLSSCLVAGS
ncbi:uncharacterized protein [Euwallacea fornicatus]|uniref:uncharacterized protein n=1 Tax=Euwallacea fornicatus TaxID=995702 RepID=UPI00338E0E66